MAGLLIASRDNFNVFVIFKILFGMRPFTNHVDRQEGIRAGVSKKSTLLYRPYSQKSTKKKFVNGPYKKVTIITSTAILHYFFFFIFSALCTSTFIVQQP